MAAEIAFTKEEMAIDEGLGYPKAYAKLCKDQSLSLYIHGPPFSFTPYILQPHEALRARELDQMFPIIDQKAKPTAKAKLFVSLLWKQLNHLGNAGFDPDIFRVDTFGNVLYYHADSASPLAWVIDHWFPCSRGGLTVPSNLRILQKKVCKKKHNKLEFLVPWWDLQLGISTNQFLSIFASSNSDFRHRAFSLLFSEGESEELNASQTVDSHIFPQHFKESKEQVGLAPASIVLVRREETDSSSTLKSLDFNRQLRPNSPIVAARKLKPSVSKENEIPEMVTNPYQAIVLARDSLKHREETVKMQAEIKRLDDEENEMRRKNEEEKMAIQDLELVLIKRRRRAEKCRRLAEAQNSYRTMLEKMIRDAMHQSVVYKEQVRLNQAAAQALMARLEAQKAICDVSEKELHRQFKQRDEIEKQIRPEWEQARKRSRMDDTLVEEERDNHTYLALPGTRPGTPRSRKDDALSGVGNGKPVLSLAGARPKTPRSRMDMEERYKNYVLSVEQNKLMSHVHKELRVFLEEEQKASEAASSLNEEQQQEVIEEKKREPAKDSAGEKLVCVEIVSAVGDANEIEDKLQMLETENGGKKFHFNFPVHQELEAEEDEESRKQRGKGNVEKWLQMLLENTPEDSELENINANETNRNNLVIEKVKAKSPQKEIQITQLLEPSNKEEIQKENKQQIVQENDGGMREEIQEKEASIAVARNSNASEMGTVGKKVGSSPSFEGKGRKETSGKERGLVRSESARTFRPIPSSPSMILSMRKGVDCIRKKPLVIGDDDAEEDHVVGNNFIRSSIKTIKKAVKI